MDLLSGFVLRNNPMLWIIFLLVAIYLIQARGFLKPKIISNRKTFMVPDGFSTFCLIFGLVISLFALYSYFSGNFLGNHPNNRIYALIVGIGFLIVSIMIYLFKRNNYISLIQGDSIVEYSNLFGQKFQFKWEDIEEISFSKDGYRTLIMKVKEKKIKFSPFWAGESDFKKVLLSRCPKQVLMVAGLIK